MSIARTLLGRRGFSLLLRPTVYAQFVAGESESEISQSMEKMSLLRLRPMLAVPIEEDLGESTGYEAVLKEQATQNGNPITISAHLGADRGSRRKFQRVY